MAHTVSRIVMLLSILAFLAGVVGAIFTSGHLDTEFTTLAVFGGIMLVLSWLAAS